MSDPSQGFDGVAAPPEVSGRLIAAGQVAPVNPNLIDGYKDLQPRLRGLLKKNGTLYGVPFMWGIENRRNVIRNPSGRSQTRHQGGRGGAGDLPRRGWRQPRPSEPRRERYPRCP